MNEHPIKFFEKNKIEPRQQQIDVLNQVYDNWKAKKYHVCSCPTGVGKTYIACAIADSFKKSYILTSTLQLQDQYQKSWREIVDLEGRSNYQCNLNDKFTVDSAPCMANQALFRDCKSKHRCAYYNQKELALAARSLVTNPSYMLYSTHCGFAKEDNEWTQRDVLIIDEAHTLEDRLVSFGQVDIEPERYEKDFGVEIGSIQFAHGRSHEAVIENYQLISLIMNELMEKAEELKEELEGEFKSSSLVGIPVHEWAKGFSSKVADRIRKMGARANALDKSIQPIKIFFNTHDESNLQERWLIYRLDDRNVLKLAPKKGGFLFDTYFGPLAEKYVFLSATMGTKSAFIKELDIKDEDCLFVQTDSPFPAILSPIIAHYGSDAIDLTYKSKAKNIVNLPELINRYLDRYPDSRGIIHASSYDIAKYIYENMGRKFLRNRSRLLYRDMEELSGVKFPRKYTNTELLEIHSKKANSVLLSPSMTEGIDLVDDLSMFQLIVKMPWISNDDLRIREKIKADPEWYPNNMWVTMMQASGRSTRHSSDYSITHVLDSNFSANYSDSIPNLPGWFKERVYLSEDKWIIELTKLLNAT